MEAAIGTAVLEHAAATAAAAAATTAVPLQQQQQQQEEHRLTFDSSRYKLHSQGAEARVWEGTFLGRPAIAKERFTKRYRHPQLDTRLTPTRLKSEVRSMLRARKLGVCTPVLYHVDHAVSVIYMELVPGHSVKTLLRSSPPPTPEHSAAIMKAIGEAVAHMHDGGLVHGDLTTSNLLIRGSQQPQQQGHKAGAAAEAPAGAAAEAPAGAAEQQQHRHPDGDPELVVIDFGLSYNSTIPEDKAVDLYVLERAFTAAHAEAGGKLFEQVLTAYRKTSKFWSATLNRFAEVRTRGRKRAMVG